MCNYKFRLYLNKAIGLDMELHDFVVDGGDKRTSNPHLLKQTSFYE